MKRFHFTLWYHEMCSSLLHIPYFGFDMKQKFKQYFLPGLVRISFRILFRVIECGRGDLIDSSHHGALIGLWTTIWIKHGQSSADTALPYYIQLLAACFLWLKC